MEIILNIQSSKPIYEQIFLQIKGQISNGVLHSGEELPSIRKLAGELQVSAITTKKAYELLIGEGYVISRPGKGMYVKEVDADFLKAKGKEEIRKKLSELIEQAKIEKIGKKEFEEMVENLYGE